MCGHFQKLLFVMRYRTGSCMPLVSTGRHQHRQSTNSCAPKSARSATRFNPGLSGVVVHFTPCLTYTTPNADSINLAYSSFLCIQHHVFYITLTNIWIEEFSPRILIENLNFHFHFNESVRIGKQYSYSHCRIACDDERFKTRHIHSVRCFFFFCSLMEEKKRRFDSL